MTHQAGLRVAEVAFLLLVFSGIWLTAAEIPRFGFAAGRRVVAGIALAAAGALLIVATRWGHFS